MNKKNFRTCIDLANKLGRVATMKNEDGRIVHTVSESSRVIFDDANEMFICIRTNVDYVGAEKYPFTITAMEYDSIKLIEIDMTVPELMEYIESLGEDWNDYKYFVSSTTIAGYNDQKTYTIRKDTNGNEILPAVGTVEYDAKTVAKK